MSTINRVHTSRFGRHFARTVSVAFATCAFLMSFTTSAFAVNVKLRIETGSATLFNGSVNTGPRAVALTDPGCIANGGTAALPSANAVTAAADWADQANTTALTSSGGAFLCGLGANVGSASAYWMMKINNKTQDPPGTYLDGTTPVNEGDAVLWYFTADYTQPTLDLVLPPTAGAGQAVAGRVDQFDSSSDAKSPGAGVAVAGDGASATTGADGLFTIAFATPGHFLVSATKDGIVRGSAWIDVSAAPVALPAPPAPPANTPVVVNRFVACTARYGKGSPKHRRCIRIVRAKQRAECLRAPARTTKHCKKVLAWAKHRRH